MNTEALLALMIVAFYLKDSLLLLRADEAVLVRGLGGRWRAGFGARGFKLGGREPYLANPFAPHAALFRLRWSMQAAATPLAAPHETTGPPRARSAEGAARSSSVALAGSLQGRPGGPLAAPAPLAWLAPFAWIAWLLLFVVIPFTVLARTGVTSTLMAVALLYANIAAALALLWGVRARLGLGGRVYALLAFECLVCAPYAANLVRRVAAVCQVNEDFTAAAERLLPPPALAEVHRECLARIDEQLEAEPEEGPTAQALKRARARFNAPTTGAAHDLD